MAVKKTQRRKPLEVSLKDCTAAIREQLDHFERPGQQTAGLKPFQFKTVELELICAVVENSSAAGGVDIKVIPFGPGHEPPAETVQKLRLTLTAPNEAHVPIVKKVGSLLGGTSEPRKNGLR